MLSPQRTPQLSRLLSGSEEELPSLFKALKTTVATAPWSRVRLLQECLPLLSQRGPLQITATITAGFLP